MRKSIVIINVFLIVFLASCKSSKNGKILESNIPIDLINPNGAYEITLYESLNLSISKLDFQKYSGKKVFCTFEENNESYLLSVLRNAVEFSLVNNGAIMLENKDDEYDFVLKYSMPVCGIHEATGVFKEKITGMVIINLQQKNKDGSMNSYTSGLVKYEFEDFIFNSYFLTFIWLLPVAAAAIFLIAFIFRKNKG